MQDKLGELIKATREKLNLDIQKLSEESFVENSKIILLEDESKVEDEHELLRIALCLKLDPVIVFSKAGLNYSDIKLHIFEKESQKNSVRNIFCASWEAFFNYYSTKLFDAIDNELVWRGHKESSWKLESTLLRDFPEGIDETFIKMIISHFKKSLRGKKEAIQIEQYQNGKNDQPLWEDEWLTLGQHYGLKTPLLDWTYSAFVATYFAYIEKNNTSPYRLIFALNKEKLSEITQTKHQETSDVRLICIDSHFNPRLINQQGLFTYGPLEQDLESWIEENIEQDESIEKIILYKFYIPNTERNKILTVLNRMNINPTTLFPDISGAANHVNLKLEIDSY